MLELTLLGPVEILVDGHPVPLPPLERNLLALLALSADAVVSTERNHRRSVGATGPRSPRVPGCRAWSRDCAARWAGR
jgi:hypothetical protein